MSGDRCVQGKCRQQFPAVAKLCQYDFAFFDGQRACPIAVIAQRHGLVAAYCHEVLGDNDDLLACSRRSLGVTGGAHITERKYVRIAAVL
ncbi:hypothetical protein D3C84_1176870 [compost metagenome]